MCEGLYSRKNYVVISVRNSTMEKTVQYLKRNYKFRILREEPFFFFLLTIFLNSLTVRRKYVMLDNQHILFS